MLPSPKKNKKAWRNFRGRGTENEVAAPEGGVVRLMQFRDKQQKCRGLQQLSASARVAFDGWGIRYACLHCQATGYLGLLCACPVGQNNEKCSRHLSFLSKNCENVSLSSCKPQMKTFSWRREHGQDETVITHSRML